MCVIAAKPANTTITQEVLQRCFDSNPDGAGFVALHEGNLVLKKGFFTFDKFWEAYQPFANDAAVIHFRIRTHGNKDAEMCHPFVVNENLVVAHNGIINIDTTDYPTKSDTWVFNELVLKPEMEASPNAYTRGSFQFLLSQTIDNSKLAFLDSSGEITIINKSKGVMEGKVWFSNASFRRTASVNCSTAWPTTGSYSSGYSPNPGRYPASGATSRKIFPASNAYTSLEDVPASEAWVVDTLRDFSFTDAQILEEINDGSADDIALDLCLMEVAEIADGKTVNRKTLGESAKTVSETELPLHES